VAEISEERLASRLWRECRLWREWNEFKSACHTRGIGGMDYSKWLIERSAKAESEAREAYNKVAIDHNELTLENLRLKEEARQLREQVAVCQAALEGASKVTPSIGTYEQLAYKRVLDALEFGRKTTKNITDKEAALGDGSERNLRLDAK
jgi:hypothetical protein